MKEIRFFYVDDAEVRGELPADEARHAIKVLRLGVGDSIVITDGAGYFYDAEIVEATPRACRYEITSKARVENSWNGWLHLAVAPTKNIDRTEWLVEKATEIGIDEISFVDCKFSERRTINIERLDRIVVSAMKQSHKASKPRLNTLMPFGKFLENCNDGEKYVAHCLNDEICGAVPKSPSAQTSRGFLPALMGEGDKTVLIGPEGDFSVEEVNAAIAHGFTPVSLGESRLRTETAALYAVMLMNLKNSKIAAKLK